ncbi:MAG: hypothetical protein ACRDF7_02400 [Candidatus Limnocylindrales bacterium]
MPNRTGGLRRALPTVGSILLAVSLAACGAIAGGTPSPSPRPTPAPSAAVPHSSDPTVLILRAEQAGGFVAPDFIVTRTPQFSLYGDGTVIYQLPPDPNAGNSLGPPALARAEMKPEQVDALLLFALNTGHLADAKAQYLNNYVADAPDTVFTLATAALSKTVTIQALGIAPDPLGPDATTLSALGQLWGLLSNFGAEVQRGDATAAGTYEPAAYRGILADGQAQPGAKPWPWTDLTTADFMASGAFGFRIGVLTPAQAKLLTDAPQGGLYATPVTGPDQTPYTIALRPLLPDETT